MAHARKSFSAGSSLEDESYSDEKSFIIQYDEQTITEETFYPNRVFINQVNNYIKNLITLCFRKALVCLFKIVHSKQKYTSISLRYPKVISKSTFSRCGSE